MNALLTWLKIFTKNIRKWDIADLEMNWIGTTAPM